MLPFNEQNNPALCTGCGACVQACPHRCITLKRDAEGFEYPVIETSCCVNCGICEEVCPANKDWRTLHKTSPEPLLYAAWHRDDGIRQQSSSGGVFTALAQSILKDGGIVFGAGFSPERRLRHVAVTNEVQLNQLRGSKYVQSCTENTYIETRNALNAGKQVLYSGTPCQIAGLYSFLGDNPEKLYTVDLICHGVPSPMVFEFYLQYMEQKTGCQVTHINFRDKRHGWHRFSMAIETKNNTVSTNTLDRDPYLVCFLRNLCLRPACMACVYTQPQRIGDITLGDFWNIGKCHPELDDDRGISEVLLNTARGEQLFQSCSDYLFTQACRFEDGIQQTMLTPSVASTRRAEFFDDLEQLSFLEIQRKYLKPHRTSLLSLLWRAASRTKRLFRQVISPKQRA